MATRKSGVKRKKAGGSTGKKASGIKKKRVVKRGPVPGSEMTPGTMW